MSSAEPMDPEDRRVFYTWQRGILCGQAGPFRHTARQARRAWHKEMRALQDYEPVDTGIPEAERPKGRPTPRQRKRRAGHG